jgi:hypothetical protein
MRQSNQNLLLQEAPQLMNHEPLCRHGTARVLAPLDWVALLSTLIVTFTLIDIVTHSQNKIPFTFLAFSLYHAQQVSSLVPSLLMALGSELIFYLEATLPILGWVAGLLNVTCSLLHTYHATTGQANGSLDDLKTRQACIGLIVAAGMPMKRVLHWFVRVLIRLNRPPNCLCCDYIPEKGQIALAV